MTREDVVIASAPGDFGKPCPSLVVQSDLCVPSHPCITICPMTSHIVDAPLFRILVEPSAANGLRAKTQIMIDKIVSVRRERIGAIAGTLEPELLLQVERNLTLWAGTGGRSFSRHRQSLI